MQGDCADSASDVWQLHNFKLVALYFMRHRIYVGVQRRRFVSLIIGTVSCIAFYAVLRLVYAFFVRKSNSDYGDYRCGGDGGEDWGIEIYFIFQPTNWYLTFILYLNAWYVVA